ncbi:MAG: hypothetical protein WCG20_02030 [bacterium]
MSTAALAPEKTGFRFFSLTESGLIEPGIPSFKQHDGTLLIKPRGKRGRQFKIFANTTISTTTAVVNKSGTFYIQSGLIQEFNEDNVLQIRDALSYSFDKVAVYLPVNLGRKLLLEETQGYVNELAHSFLILKDNTSFTVCLGRSFYKVTYLNKELTCTLVPFTD